MAITIRELPLAEAHSIGYPLLHALNPDMSEPEYHELLDIVSSKGEVLVGLFQDDHLAALAGYWIKAQFWCGRFMEPDNLIVLPEHRGKGYGQMLMHWLEEKAAALDCQILLLKSYKSNEAATVFYDKLGYRAPGNVFVKPLMGWDAWEAMLNARGQKTPETIA